MSTQHNDGGPAFPIAFQHRNESDGVIEQRWLGLSLRDYFAAQALIGMSVDNDVALFQKPEGCAEWAYKLADAMLRAREATT